MISPEQVNAVTDRVEAKLDRIIALLERIAYPPVTVLHSDLSEVFDETG